MAADPAADRASEAPAATRLPRPAVLLLAAVLVTNIGNGMHTLVVSKLLYDATGSSAAFGVVLVGEYAINFLLQLVAGSAVDRGNPRLVSVWADLLRGAFICIVAVMLGASGSGKYWVFATVIVITAAKPFYRSATFALAPIVVQADQLLMFNGLSGSLLQAGQLLGVALVGPVLANFSVATAFALNGISFLASGVLILCARVPAVARPPRSTGSFLHDIVHDWGEIIRLLRRDLALAAHVVLCAGDFLLVSFINLTLVPYVNERLGGTAYWLSVLDGGFAIGALTAGGLSAAIISRFGARRVSVTGPLVQAALFASLAIAPSPYVAVAAMVALGAANNTSLSAFMTTLQQRCRGPIRGRIASVRHLSLSLLAGVAIPLVAMGQGVSLETGILVGACWSAAFGIAAFALGTQRAFGRRLLSPDAVGAP